MPSLFISTYIRRQRRPLLHVHVHVHTCIVLLTDAESQLHFIVPYLLRVQRIV